ncbi:MAG: 6-phosphofructokinase [Lachnospiraceae bacterium]|nr:6-phosphofructokinase [Lachnospiraceae bacterium]
MKKQNCIVAQSGGPTAAINASLAGVIDAALKSNSFHTVYGSINGIQGVLQHKIISLNETFENNPDAIHTLMTSPAMYLGSCRYKLPDFKSNPTQYEFIFETFRQMDIHSFFYIGGNDSMDTVDKLSQYAKSIDYDICIIGIPKTIDNDLMETDHTPGFGSAAKFVATSMLEIAHDTYIFDIESVTIVEIMGRDAGWLTASAALARNSYNHAPDLIYLPEHDFSTFQFVNDLNTLLKANKNVIVAVSEGVHDEQGNYICSTQAAADKFGHAQLSGTGKTLEHLVKSTIGCKVRSIELNVLQRSAMHISSLTDITEAFQLGSEAVKAAEMGLTSIMLTLNRENNHPYTISIGNVPVSEVANAAKSVPIEWINESGNDVTEEMIEYLLPLIEGEPHIRFKNGIPDYLSIKHLI